MTGQTNAKRRSSWQWRSAFVSETPFHGFSYVAASDERFSRVFWITIMVACACGMAYQVGTAIQVFTEYRLSTSYTVIQQEELKVPDVVICIPARFDKYRMAKHSVSDDLTDFVAMGLPFGSFPYVTGIDAREYISFNKSFEFIPEFMEKTSDGSQYQQLVNNLAFECDDIMTEFCYKGSSIAAESCCRNATRFYGRQGLCWNIPGPYQVMGGQGNGLMMRLRLPKERYFYGLLSMFYKGVTMQFSFDQYVDNDVIAVEEGSRVQVSVTATHGKYLSTTENPCRDEPEPAFACIAKCVRPFFADSCNCKAIDAPFDVGSNETSDKICTPVNLAACKLENNAYNRQYRACAKVCRYPCDIWQYGKTVSSYKIDAEATQRYKIKDWDEKNIILDIYYATLQLVEISQYRAMSVEDLFGIIGGLSGLWLGGSIVAVTHMVCFWMRGLCRLKSRNVEAA